MQILKTKTKASDGKIIFIPNLTLINGNIINYSRGQLTKISVEVAFKNYEDFDRIKEIAIETCKETNGVYPNLSETKESILSQYLHEKVDETSLTPQINIANIQKEKITIKISFWTCNVSKKEEIKTNFYSNLMNNSAKTQVELA